MVINIEENLNLVLKEGMVSTHLKMVKNIEAILKETKQHGLGQYKYNNGEVFKGEFKNNIRDGQGFIVFRGDTIKSGIWKNDQFLKKIRLKNVTRNLKTIYPTYKKTKNPPRPYFRVTT